MNPHSLSLPEVLEVDISGLEPTGDQIMIHLEKISKRNDDIIGNYTENITYESFASFISKLFAFQRMFGPDGFPSTKRNIQFREYIVLLSSLLPILSEGERRSIEKYLQDENISEYNFQFLIQYGITPDNILSKLLTSPHSGNIETIPYADICAYELFRLHAEEFQKRAADKNYILHSENPDAYVTDDKIFVLAQLSMSLEVLRAYLESPYVNNSMAELPGNSTTIMPYFQKEFAKLIIIFDTLFRSSRDHTGAAFLESHFRAFYEAYGAIFRKIVDCEITPRQLSLKKFFASKCRN